MAKFVFVALALLYFKLITRVRTQEERDASVSPCDNTTINKEEASSSMASVMMDAQPTTVEIEKPIVDAGGMVDNVEAELNSDGSMRIKPAATHFLNVAPLSDDLVPLVKPAVDEMTSSTSDVRGGISLSSIFPELAVNSTPQLNEDSGKTTERGTLNSVETTLSGLITDFETTPTTQILINSEGTTKHSGIILEKVENTESNTGNDKTQKAEISWPAADEIEPSKPLFEFELEQSPSDNPVQSNNSEPEMNVRAKQISESESPTIMAAPTNLPVFSVLVAGLTFIFLN